MPDDRTSEINEREVTMLREEVRKLRDEQLRQARLAVGNGGDGQKVGEKKPEEAAKKEEQKEDKPHPYRKFVIIAAVLVLAVVGLVWWLHSRQFESTDDATVDGHISTMGARAAGTVVAVYVEENQFVKAGQVVADLDPRDFDAAVRQARGAFYQATGEAQAQQPSVPVVQVSNQTSIANANSEADRAESGIMAAERNYQAALEKVKEAEANRTKAQADVERYRPLAEKDEVPREQFDTVVANAKALDATVAANQAMAQAALKQVDQSKAQLKEAEQRAQEARQNAPRQEAIQRANVVSRQANAESAKARLDQALLNLSYCKIVTPVSGIVAKRVVEVGQQVAAGQQLILVTQNDDLWVTANFRETQLRRMHPGQSAAIHVDALDLDFEGYLESMPAASGAITSLLPPENATGNFVKVVQRLPVRIRFKKDQNGYDRLRPGMSVEPKVRVE